MPKSKRAKVGKFRIAICRMMLWVGALGVKEKKTNIFGTLFLLSKNNICLLLAVHLTQTGPKSRDNKAKLVDEIRASIDDRARLFVFSFENMRTSFFQGVRKEWPESKFFLCKNKVGIFGMLMICVRSFCGCN